MNNNAIAVLRYSWVALFLWFGFQQIVNPESWVGFLPEFAGYFPVPPTMLVMLNGWTEVICALALLAGVYTKPVAAFLALHLFGIAATVGGAIGMRDFVLGMIGVALALSDVDYLTLDYKRA